MKILDEPYMTLNELIVYLEKITLPITHEAVKKDCIHYLKTYQANQQAYIEQSQKAEEARERYLEAVKNCELTENKYRKLIEETSQNFATTSQNDPLTWDELKGMEGKPIWVEILSDKIDLSSRWMMVARETKTHSLPLVYTDDIGHWIYGHEDKLGKSWQAYRKEQSEEIK